jgi:hypothetical protein
MALAITDDATFDEVVLKSDKPVVVDFGQLGADHVEWLDQLSRQLQNMKKENKSERVDVDATKGICCKNTV